jgi:hypothetical protein
MKAVIKIAIMSTLVAAGAQAIADDSPSAPTSMTHTQKKQLWNDCMAKQKAENASMTQAAMQTACKNEMKKNKLKKDGNDLTTAPQATPNKDKD